jgi:paraquat-inducible protein B
LDVFIFQPYDQLIRAGDRFWKTSAVRLKFAGGAIDATLAPISTIFSGGIELDTTAATPGSPQSRAESEFTLYASRDAARQGLSGPTVRYSLAFAGAAGDLEAGAPVTLLGFQIGEVAAARLAYDERTGKPLTAVSVLIYPQQLDPARLAAGTVTDWPAAADAKMRQLIGFGYRAKLDQTPPLVGGRSIALVPTTGAGPSNLAGPGPSNLSSSGSGGSGGHRTIPTVPDSADFADIASRAAQILAKVNGMPLEDIGQNLKAITRRVRALVSSPEVADSLAHLDGSLTQIDELLGQVKPQLGPLVAKLNDAAGEISGIAAAAHQLLGSGGGGQDANLPDAIRQLTEAARAVRTLADYLDRHPEALIHGKRPEK